MYIGCHVSIAGGIQNAPERAADLGCEAMQIFTRSPQGGKTPPITPEIAELFKIQSTKHEIQNTYIHTPYYINLPSQNNRIRYGSAKAIREELERGSLIGAKYVMTHIGTAKDLGEKEALKKVIYMLKQSLDGYNGSTKLLIENSAGAGLIIGDDLKEIADIIKGVDNPTIAGICLDTQHSFASGYDWNNFKNTIKRIDEELGLDKIKLIHANNSQSALGSRRDRHAHIGEGNICLDCFKNIVTFAKMNNIDMILETEHDKVKEDIEVLKKLRNQCS